MTGQHKQPPALKRQRRTRSQKNRSSRNDEVPALPKAAPMTGPPSRAGALVPPRPQLDGAVRNGDPEGRPDGALDQPDLAAMSAHELGRDRQAEAGATGAVRALE